MGDKQLQIDDTPTIRRIDIDYMNSFEKSNATLYDLSCIYVRGYPTNRGEA